MTIAELYQTALEELAGLEQARARLLGRADVLAELCAAGLRDVAVTQHESAQSAWDTEPEPLSPVACRLSPES